MIETEKMKKEFKIETSPTEVVLIVAIVATLSFFCGAAKGYDMVHRQWKKDAIERCSVIKDVEWCTGRAEIEKW